MIDVVAALIEKNGKYLIAKRSTGDPQNLEKWEFPGGKVEPGEVESAAIEREIREELEIEVVAEKFLTHHVFEYPNKKIDLKLYECKYLTGEIVTVSHSEVQWVTLEEMDHFNFAPADILLIEKLKGIEK